MAIQKVPDVAPLDPLQADLVAGLRKLLEMAINGHAVGVFAVVVVELDDEVDGVMRFEEGITYDEAPVVLGLEAMARGLREQWELDWDGETE